MRRVVPLRAVVAAVVAAVVVVVVVVVGGVGVGGGFDPTAARGADVPTVPVAPVPPVTDPYAPPVRVPAIAEPPVLVRHDLAGDLVLRTTGRVSHRRVVTGTLPAGATVPGRSFDGTVDLVRRVRLVGAKRMSTIEGPFAATGRSGDDPPKSATVPLSLAFEEGPRGAAVIASIRFTAPGISVDDLEALQRAFTDRFGPPDRAVRVGEPFSPSEGMAVEDTFLRVAFRLSQRQFTGRAPVLPVPEGAVWADGLVGQGADAALVVRAAITHAHAADTDDPKAPENLLPGVANHYASVRQYRGDAIVVRTVDNTIVFRGEGLLAGFDPAHLN